MEEHRGRCECRERICLNDDEISRSNFDESIDASIATEPQFFGNDLDALFHLVQNFWCDDFGGWGSQVNPGTALEFLFDAEDTPFSDGKAWVQGAHVSFGTEHPDGYFDATVFVFPFQSIGANGDLIGGDKFFKKQFSAGLQWHFNDVRLSRECSGWHKGHILSTQGDVFRQISCLKEPHDSSGATLVLRFYDDRFLLQLTYEVFPIPC